MANGLRLKGGQASTGPHKINAIHTVMTRQRFRYEMRKAEYLKVRQEFQLPRRVSRSIARARSHWTAEVAKKASV